jgi:pimeloyl-ACP methyl ester carboxylesterase
MPPFSHRLLPWPILILAVFALAGCQSRPGSSKRSVAEPTAPAGLEQAVARGGANGIAIAKAGRALSPPQQAGLQFLLENMPEPDLRGLPPSLLIENVSLAYEAFAKAPWREQIPEEIFLNDILPYACVNEKRDPWREELRGLCAPLIADCQTPAEAAQRLNQTLFKLVKVRYSTDRKKADQSPLESIESGVATCTGLSILLVDACRSVGVPARLVATPMWTNLRGNHTWVEIWDGQWHFTGAAEPDPKGLNRGWFGHDASQARKDEPRHAIYASSFKKTGLSFPLVWARKVDWVSAVNVTDNYKPKAKPADAGTARLSVKVLDRPGGRRVATQVTITESTNAAAKVQGTTQDESADSNDLLTFEIARDRAYDIQAGERKKAGFRAGTNAQELLVLYLADTPAFTVPSQARYVAPAVTQPLKATDEAKLRQALTEFFVAPTNRQATWKFASRLERLLKENEPAVRRVAWQAFRAAPIHDSLKEDYDARQVRFQKHLSPYTVKTVGTRPTNGWALFIAMHGGGGAPKQVNDSQWKHMQIYYRDHPEAGGYLYVALRAPNDSWNGFYDTYVYPLIANLTRQFRLHGDVDPNKIFIMGYSHGGYGAFAIGPKIPDQFAAVHASAAAPTDGESTAKTLRNTIFTAMVGEKDTLYGRHDRNIKFADTVEKLRGSRTDIYPVRVDIIAGNGHGGLPDRDNILGMYPAVRNPVPRELTWLMTDKVIKDFFWLHTEMPGKQREINAVCRDNRLVVTTTTNVTAASVLLDSRLVDFSKRVTLELNGKRSSHKLQPSLRVLCATLQQRGDPDLAFTAELPLPLSTGKLARAEPSRIRAEGP